MVSKIYVYFWICILHSDVYVYIQRERDIYIYLERKSYTELLAYESLKILT